MITESLRIGLVCPYSLDTPGGVQNHVLGLARQLLDQGHQPYVLAPGRMSAAAAEILDPLRFTSAGRAIPVPYNGSTARINFGPRTAARVRSWLRSVDFDVVHLHEPITPSVSILALAAAECPVVGTFHTATPRSRTMHLAGQLLRPLIDRIDAGIAVSEPARDVVVRHLGRDPLVVPNGIRLADFPVGRADRSRSRVVFLGRADEPRKGLDLLLAAAPTILAHDPSAEILIAGSGRSPLPPGCRALGAITDAERADLLASAAVFVAPQRARESFGIVVLEAMAAGAPVVASDLPAFRDLLRTGTEHQLGTLFANGDPAALADAVISTLRTPHPDRTAAARRAAAQYDWSQIGPRIETVYRAARDTWARQPVDPGERSAATWAELDAALTRRARLTAAWASAAPVDPITATALVRAAGEALQPDLSRSERERVETDLSLILRRLPTPIELGAEGERVRLARRLHNDAVSTARVGRSAPTWVRGGHADGQPFEMADHRT